jgi:class 3 adenylate cyclase
MPEEEVGRVSRKLAAILAADVVGYSRLMEKDESDHLVPRSMKGRSHARFSALPL